MDRHVMAKRSNLVYLATIPEDCEITAMCEHNGLLYIATDKNKVWCFDPETCEFVDYR